MTPPEKCRWRVSSRTPKTPSAIFACCEPYWSKSACPSASIAISTASSNATTITGRWPSNSKENSFRPRPDEPCKSWGSSRFPRVPRKPRGASSDCGEPFRTACVLEQVGVPLSIYRDQHGIFQRNDDHWSVAEKLQGEQFPTQAGRALQELGIVSIPARTAQAKGRIET